MRILIILVFSISIFSAGYYLQTIHAEHPAPNDFITKSLTGGTIAIIDYRNTANTSPQSVTLDINSTSPKPGDTITVTVDEEDGNLDISALDVLLARANSQTSGSVNATIQMTETGVNTGFFSGTLILSSSTTTGNNLEFGQNDQLNVFYEPESNGVGRLQLELNVATSGDVRISDDPIDLDEFQINESFRPVTHPVQVELQNGATLNDNAIVTISYANAVFQTNDNPSQLNMYFKRDDIFVPGVGTIQFGWEKIRDQTAADPNSHDANAKTITSDLANTQFGINGNTILFGTLFVQPLTGGQFLLGFEQGIGGGGGGGLVRPGLVVNILAGASSLGAGGGSGPPGPTITLGAVALHNSASETISMPQEIRDLVLDHDPQTPLEPITDIYEDFDLPLSINGNGFALGGYENTLVTQTIEPGVPNEFNIVFYTNSEIAHTSLYFNLGPTGTIGGSDTQVLLYKDRPVEIIDPNGNIASATGTINNEGELKRVVTFSLTFSEDIQWSNSDLIIRAWNDNLNSGDTIVYDAIQIAPSEEEIAFEENIPEPEVEQLKSQHIPIWIKNNANWWSQELIDDEDFVAGLEYLIQNNIVTIPDSEITINEITTQKIPSWIKNTAGWWSENQITEKEFIDGIQWLISNGIIKVVET